MAQVLRFSIITATLNRREMLAEAVESVRAQQWPAVEHIVVDGGSTDGSLEWLSSQPDLKVLHGPDRGVYDAINKGIAAATGDAVGILNSDDLYEDGAFAAMAEALADDQVASVAGKSRLFSADRIVEVFDREQDLVPDARSVLLGRCLPNPRAFRRASLLALGPFSLDYALTADRDLLLRYIESGAKTAVTRRYVYRYRQHAGSLTFDAGLRHSLRLRKELVRLGVAWKARPSASPQARAAARCLEGRNRIMIMGSALRRGAIREAIAPVSMHNDKLSVLPLLSMTEAVLDAVMNGRC